MDAQELRNILKEENFALEERIMTKIQNILTQEHEKFKATLDEQNSTIEQLKNENRDLQKRMMSIEQYSRRSNIQINNIPVIPNENIQDLLCEIGVKIGVQLNYGTDIQAAHRVPSKSENNKPIIVKFSNRDKRTSFIVAAKKAKLTCSQLDMTKNLLFSAGNKIYFNDHLTAESRKIFNEARKAVREKKVQAAWTMNGRIFVKRDDMSQRQEIGDMADLKPFLVPYNQIAS